MADFWLATFDLKPERSLAQSAARPLVAAGARAWAIEVIKDASRNEYAVLFSTVDDPLYPTELACRIGFANGSQSCSVWRDRGFPLVDAVIEQRAGGLSVRSPCFTKELGAMCYEKELIWIDNAMFAPGSGAVVDLATKYEQSQQAPDYALPATWLRRRAVEWIPARSNVKAGVPARLKLTLSDPRCPSLLPFKRAAVTPKAIWSGAMDLPLWPPNFSKAPAQRASRADTFGVPAFRFEDVEVLGFRLDLDALGFRGDDALASMIARLNFHLDPSSGGMSRTSRSAVSDFRYQPATRVVTLELLRYGAMKLKTASPPLELADFQSQHELLIRMLVGRIDDDTAQAHDPATFVPAIFVDNPWSKVLGRDVQGFDKRMADFCVVKSGKPEALRPDGRLAEGQEPESLGRVARIYLSTNTGTRPSDQLLLEIDCDPDAYDDWEAFEPIDLELALGTSALAPTRWRQSDFDNVEFRRSFARSAVTETLKGFRSIQVSPVGERKLQDKWSDDTTWITGTFVVDDDVLIARPNGIVRLTLYANRSAPPAWRSLCELLGIKETERGEISLPTGSWYRMRCSMDLMIDNGLD